jgi:hypothetical protein
MNDFFNTYKYLAEGLIKQINAKYILEIGLGQGTTTRVCLEYLKQKNEGRYTAIDFDPPKNGLDILNEYDKSLWELRVADTTKDDNVFQNFHDKRNDIILIDGSHHWSHVAQDIHKIIIYGCAKPETIFLFHDSEGSHTRHGIAEACKNLRIDLFEIVKGNVIIGKLKDLSCI